MKKQTLYKLTDENDCTYGDCQWGVGVTVHTSGEGELCGSGFTHWYTDPLLAVLLNPIHGDFDLRTAHLWEGEGVVKKRDYGLKVGCTNATTLRRIELPKVTTTQRVAFAIYCAQEVSSDTGFMRWADVWLTGEDRSAEAAAKQAARAAEKTVRAAWAADYTARAAERAARAAEQAAWAADYTARAARAVEIDFIALARKAITVKEVDTDEN